MFPTLFFLSALGATPAAGAGTEYARPQLLLEPSAVKEFAGRGGRILDARGKKQYSDGHVPGAVWVDATTWARAFKDGQDGAGWSQRIGELGITTDTPVALYGEKLNEAARMWWVLRYWGVRDVRLVNGGWKGWLALGQNPEERENTPQPVAPRLEPSRKRLTTKAELLGSLKSWQILDARSLEEHCGTADSARRNGAIPGAVHVEWSETIDQKTGRFKSAAELAKLFKDAGLDLQRPIVAHCQSGGRSSAAVFALELLGAADARNYYKSWAEWGNDDDTPVVRPKKRE
jgi:thiosulfate/3-mercaptopyruvate sulfurtransferase